MINPRIFAFLAIVGFFIFLAFGGNIIFPKKEVKVEEEPAAIIIIENITTILVTPTPDGHIYFASEYQNGTRLLKRPYSFIRYNALYRADMKVTTIVYDYKFFDKLHWFNPAQYKYQEMLPANQDSKFCIIFIYIFMDDVVGDDTRMWAFNRSYFAVYDGTNVIENVPYPYQLRFKELEETSNFNGDSYIQAFKQTRVYNENEYAVKTAGEMSEETYYLRGGRSNAIDGYMIYEIPKTKTAEDLTVLANFASFGNANWRFIF